jgi:hypothetical protein
MRIFPAFLLLLLSFSACLQPQESSSEDTAPEKLPKPHRGTIASADPAYQTKDFANYWYANQAELTGYTLEQSRYGEIHRGDAVLIYVTEPFSAEMQVKLDNASASGEDKVNVLKLNYTKKFLTGIYPYSLMTSVFTPVAVAERPYSLKVSTTAQEWCGHSFLQFNWRGPDYLAQGYSYFESEGDVETTVQPALLEDELWTRLRLDPGSIPTGEVSLMPATMYLRLLHRPLKPVPGIISRGDTTLDETECAFLRVYYPAHERELLIYHESDFPYAVLGWDEIYDAPTYTGQSQELKTTARRSGTLKSPYWQQHLNRHRKLRQQLGLPTR